MGRTNPRISFSTPQRMRRRGWVCERDVPCIRAWGAFRPGERAVARQTPSSHWHLRLFSRGLSIRAAVVRPVGVTPKENEDDFPDWQVCLVRVCGDGHGEGAGLLRRA